MCEKDLAALPGMAGMHLCGCVWAVGGGEVGCIVPGGRQGAVVVGAGRRGWAPRMRPTDVFPLVDEILWDGEQ